MKVHQTFVGFIDFETSFKITKKIPWEIELPTIGREGVEKTKRVGRLDERNTSNTVEDPGWDLIDTELAILFARQKLLEKRRAETITQKNPELQKLQGVSW